MKTFLATLFLGIALTTPVLADSKFDLNFGLGPSLSQGGAIDELGEPNLYTNFEFNYFIAPKHGIGFAINNALDLDGSSRYPRLDDASLSTIDIHYAYRHAFGKIHLVFEPGFGWQTLYDESSDIYGYHYYDDLSTALVLNYKLFARYILNEWDSGDGANNGQFYVGTGITHIFSMNDDYNGHDISGNRLAMIFQIGIGW